MIQNSLTGPKLKYIYSDTAPTRIVILASESHRAPKLRDIDYAELSVSAPNYWSMLQVGLQFFVVILELII